VLRLRLIQALTLLWIKYNFVLNPVIVFTDLNGKSFFVITTGQTWADAQLYCRQTYTDLALIESEAENNEVSALISQSCSYAWIGHHEDPWRWSDNSPVKFRHWNTYPLYFSSTKGCVNCLQEMNETKCPQKRWKPNMCVRVCNASVRLYTCQR
uniref:C-type lectin domain-containing protein n=1 Tax=Periophthalmus magnuspinnatus TaxID=409849 RepID=A0A3B4AN38_9GOBI